MTAFGKILVVIILLMAVLGSVFMMMIHVASTNWHLRATEYEQAFKDAAVERQKAEQQAAEAQKKAVDLEAKYQQELVNKDNEIAARNGDIARLKRENDTKQTALDTANAAVEAARAKLDRQELEVRKLTADIEDPKTGWKARYNLVLAEKDELRERATRAEILAESLQVRNSSLVQVNEDLQKELTRAKAGATNIGTVAALNPPPGNIEGTIKNMDNDGRVLLTIGSDSGLREGHTLEVFRLSRVPSESRYLGTIRVMEVRPHEAVGIPVKKPVGGHQIKIGDRVASKILGS